MHVDCDPKVDTRAPQRAQFGSFEILLGTGELTNAGQPVRLAPQPSRVLALLVRRAGELVTREEIQAEVWSDGTVVEFDQGLNYCIRQIRLALSENAKEPQYIETVPKRGYRFIAHVAPAADDSEAAKAAPVTLSRRWIMASAVCGLVAAPVWRWKGDRPKLPRTPQAKRLFEDAQYLTATRNPENASKARDEFKEVTRLDPDFAPAWAGLATAELTRPPAGKSAEFYTAAEMHARHAISLDPELAEAHVALAHSLYLQRKWDEAEPEFKTALRLDDDLAEAHHLYGMYLTARARKEAVQHAERAQQLEHLSGIISQGLAIAYHHAGNYEMAVRQSERTLNLLHHYQPAYNWLVRGNIMLGRRDAALAAMEESVRIGRADNWGAWRAYMFARDGNVDQARDELQKARESSARSFSIAVSAGLCALGDKDGAFAALEGGSADGWAETMLKATPELEPLRSDPRFQTVLRRLGNP